MKNSSFKKENPKMNLCKKNILRNLAVIACCAAIFAAAGCAAEKAASDNTVTAAAAETGGTQPEASEAAAADTGAKESTVTVTAKGNVFAVPDMAELRFGVRTQDENAAEAQRKNAKDVDAVISVLKSSGVKEENIQTTWYDVSPQYDWNTGDGDTIIGYTVSTSLSVKGVKIDDAGKLITACTEAGANEFNGASYSCSNYDELYGEALQKAVAASKEKAALLASSAGRNLGDVRMISEGYQDTTYAYAAAKGGMSADAGYGAPEESVEASLMPGQAEITANVTVTYALQ